MGFPVLIGDHMGWLRASNLLNIHNEVAMSRRLKMFCFRRYADGRISDVPEWVRWTMLGMIKAILDYRQQRPCWTW